jgi:predicted metal-dependent hydrolase
VERSHQGEWCLRYGEEEIAYSVTVNPKRRGRVGIHVHPDGEVEVEAPESADPKAIQKAVQKRARWVVSHVRSVRQRFRHVLPREYVSGEQILYLGRRYSLKVRKARRRERSVKLKGNLLVVTTDDTAPETVRPKLRAWYRFRARNYFADRIAAVADGLPWRQPVAPFQLLEMKKRWGTCGAGGVVTLNPFLVRAPRECIDYVIAHELCHLREHNHSPAFFRLLTRAMPDWEEIKLKLDEMAEVILND